MRIFEHLPGGNVPKCAETGTGSSQKQRGAQLSCGAFAMAMRTAGAAGLGGSGGRVLALGAQHGDDTGPDTDLQAWLNDVGGNLDGVARMLSAAGLGSLESLKQRFAGLEKDAVDDMLRIVGVESVSDRIMLRNRLLKLCDGDSAVPQLSGTE